MRALAAIAVLAAALLSPVAIAYAQPDTVTVELPRCHEEDCSDLVGTDTGAWVDPQTGTVWVMIVD